MKIIDIFKVPLFIHNIFIDEEKCNGVISQIEWKHKNTDVDISFKKNLLDDSFVFLNQEVKNCIDFAFEVMGFHGVSYQITSSWLTKTLSQKSSSYHFHSNSFLSGVVYFQNQTSPIKFLNPYICSYSHSSVPYLCSDKKFVPNIGDIIIFPSNLYHMIDTNKSKDIRYSLAFNILPCGEYGYGDSRVIIN